MAESYVPEGVFVVCDKMTCGQPRKLLCSRSKANVIHSSKPGVLLTIADKKIDASFECVVKGIFWGGLQALALGVCIGALVLATVATGGAALVVAAAAATVSIGAGIAGLCSIAHACDATLESSWKLYNNSVSFNKSNALLNKSVLKCVQGGVINIIFDEQTAINAARAISDSNMNAFYWQIGSQFTMGLITAVTSGGGIALIGAGVLAIPAYYAGEKLNVNSNAAENAIVGTGSYGASQLSGYGVQAVGHTVMAGGNVAGSLPTTLLGGVINAVGANAQKAAIQDLKDVPVFISAGLQSLRGYATYGAGILSGNVGTQLEGALRTAVGSNKLKGINAKGIGSGIAGAIANIVIGTVSDNHEDEKLKEAKEAADTANNQDSSNSISVLSLNG